MLHTRHILYALHTHKHTQHTRGCCFVSNIYIIYKYVYTHIYTIDNNAILFVKEMNTSWNKRRDCWYLDYLQLPWNCSL